MELIITLAGLLLAAAFVYAFVHKLKHRRRDELLSKMASPPSYPIIGNAWLFIRTPGDLWQSFKNFIAEYETPFVFWCGNIPIVIASKLDDIEEISKKCLHRETYGLVDGIFGDGIISQGYDKWKKSRRLFNSAFGPLMLNQYTCVFNEQASILIEVLRPHADTGKSVDVWPFLVNASIDMITENMIGVKPSTQKNFGNDFSEAIIDILHIIVSRAMNPFLHNNFVFRIYTWLTGKTRTIESLYAFPKEALEKAKREVELRKESCHRKNSLSMPEKPPQSMIGILLAAHGTDLDMTDQQMQDEMIQLIAAGSETTALTIGFLMLMFGINQDVQEKAYNEIIHVIGQNESIQMDDLSKLQYLEQCIRETLRKFTIVPVTYRNTTNNVTLPKNEIIPPGCPVILHLKSVHDSPEHYPDPNRWNPDNFSPAGIEARHKNSFVAFGLGPRSCLGSKYAIMSVKIQMSYILRKYHVQTLLNDDDIEVATDILQRSAKGYPVTLTSRRQTTEIYHF